MKEKIKSFTNLKTWQEGHRLVLKIYKITDKFPRKENFGLIPQMRRCVISITSNIAEGFSRKTSKEKSRFYYMALGSITELQNQLIIARDLDYLNKKEFNKTYFLDLYGKTKNLNELAALIKLSDLLLCVDSAPMHIGVGVGTKLVAIFGPTDENKLLPGNKNFTAVKNTELTCRPCLWDKRNEVCENLSCLDISVQQICDAINKQQIS